jgi:hypothetical protein
MFKDGSKHRSQLGGTFISKAERFGFLQPHGRDLSLARRNHPQHLAD